MQINVQIKACLWTEANKSNINKLLLTRAFLHNYELVLLPTAVFLRFTSVAVRFYKRRALCRTERVCSASVGVPLPAK